MQATSQAVSATAEPSSLDAFWMPFTANRKFKRDPRFVSGAEGMHYTMSDGSRVMDGIAGLWCVNAGHRHPVISEALKKQIDTLDYASNFQLGHRAAFELADRLADWAPADLNRVFFTNSGSESVDTALKIALAYHRARGDAGRYRLIGRARSYHGVGFGGISVAGIAKHRNAFGPLLNGVDHLPHTHDPLRNAFSRGEPPHGLEHADALEAICAVHDPATIAAVIVEPIAGSTGVLPPPVGYLKRLREICDRHGILLIFDEVITGFGRLGSRFAADHFGVVPDLMASAKGLTNGVIPMGAVFVRDPIHAAFMQGSEAGVEFAHGYTYSGHPLACAAALATLKVHQDEDLAGRCAAVAPVFADALHDLRGEPAVADVRNLGLLAGVELTPFAGRPAARAQAVEKRCLEQGLLVRALGETIALSPPLVVSHAEVAQMADTLRAALRHVDAQGPAAA